MAQFLNASNVNAGRKKEINHENGNGHHPILVNANKTAPPGFLPHPTPNGTKLLITPAMLATTTSSSIHNNNNNNNNIMNGGVKQSEPLNRNQLVQALSYLIENDEDFTQKVHEAYLKSMKSSS